MKAWTRRIPHVADIRLAFHADTLEELFAEAARVIAGYGGSQRGTGVVAERVALHSQDAATLLADWINELLGLSEIHSAAFRSSRIEVAVSDTDARVHADLTGVRMAEWRCPIKAATYHELRLDYRRGRWRAMVLCDT